MLIQYHVINLTLTIHLDPSRDLERVAHRAMNAQLLQLLIRSREIVSRSNDDIVGQLSEQHQHLLGGKGMFVPTRQSESLLIALVLGFDATPTAIVRMSGGEGHRLCVQRRGDGLSEQMKQHGIRQVENQDVITPLAGGLVLADRQLARGVLAENLIPGRIKLHRV